MNSRDSISIDHCLGGKCICPSNGGQTRGAFTHRLTVARTQVQTRVTHSRRPVKDGDCECQRRVSKQVTLLWQDASAGKRDEIQENNFIS